MGIYALLAILFLFLFYREIEHGPEFVGSPAGDVLDAPASTHRG
jgi:hypothetical protein